MEHINLTKHFGGKKVKITGLVTEIYEGEIQKGKSKGQPFFTITLDNDDKLYLYTKENYDRIENVEEGKTYEFTCERFRNYLNITGDSKEVAPQEVLPSSSQTAKQTNSGATPAPMTERYYKNRISALVSTVDWLKEDTTTTDEDFEKKFNQFLNLIIGQGD